MVYTPHQNGVVERLNMNLLQRESSILINPTLLKEFWAEAVLTADYLINRSPSTSKDYNILEEVWSGNPYDYLNIKIFGCDAYALVPNNQRSKLDLKSKCYVFVRNDYGVRGYRLWDPTTHKIIINKDVIFDKLSIMKLGMVDGESKWAQVPQIQ